MANTELADDANAGFFTGLIEELRVRAARPQTALEKQLERDRLRTALQMPIAVPRYLVLYLVNGRERRSAWLHSFDRAQRGLKMMQSKYGKRNAIIFRD